MQVIGAVGCEGSWGGRWLPGSASPGERRCWGMAGSPGRPEAAVGSPGPDGLTFVGAEAIFAVLVEVVGGRAPEEAVAAARVGAAGVLLAVEQERELAELPVSVPVLHADH